MKLRDELAAIRCISGERVLEIALQAYYAAGRAILEDFKASGEPWMLEGRPWTNSAGFLWQVHHEFTHRLSLYAQKRRLQSPGMSGDGIQWYQPPEKVEAVPDPVPDFSGPSVNDLHPAPVPCDAGPDAVPAAEAAA